MTLTINEPLIRGEVITDDSIGTTIALINSLPRLSVDTETDGLDVRNKRNHCMGICLYNRNNLAAYVPFRHQTDNVSMRYLPYLWSAICSRTEIDWHHLKFDMHSLATLGLNPLEMKATHYDAMIMFTLWNEELYSKEMDYLAGRFLKINKYESDRIHKSGEYFGYANLPPEIYRTYGPQDAYINSALRDFVWPKLVAEGTDKVYLETEEPYIKVLYQREQLGIGVDVDFCNDRAEIGTGRMATLRRDAKVDIASTKQLGKFLLEELKLPVIEHTDKCKACKEGQPVDSHTGNPSFNKRVMEEYDDILSLSNNPVARKILEFRGWQKAVTSLYIPSVEKRGPDGRLRTDIKQHRTVTGRDSSSDPNLQQIPRHTNNPWNGQAKRCFTTGYDPEEWGVFGWDYAQLEFRLAASYGQEQILLAEFAKDNADPFSVLAPTIFADYNSEPWHCLDCKVNDQRRHEVKNRLVYPSLYGAGLKKVAMGLGVSVADAIPVYNRYKASIPGITQVSEQVREVTKARGWVRYWDGRRRHIRNRSDVHTRAWNSVLQGGAAQLVKKAQIRIQNEICDENCKLVLAVHDELVFLIRRSMVKDYEPLIIAAMIDFPMFKVRLIAEGKEWK